MASYRRVSQRGIDLIKSFEGFHPTAVRLEEGRWMVGYGHTDSAEEDTRLTKSEAQAVLREYDLPVIEAAISETVLAPLNQNEFDALVSFGWNVGEDAFRVSQVVAELNAGARLKAAAAFGPWRKARINGRLMVVDALVRRRAIEVALFLSDPSGRPIAPSAAIRPQLDLAAAFAAPEPDASIVAAEVQGDAVTLFEAPPRPDQAPASDTPPQDNTAAEAVRRVSERLTRILGEPAPDEEDTPEDITTAVSALVDAESGPKSAAPDEHAAPADAANDDGLEDDDTPASALDEVADNTTSILDEAKPDDTTANQLTETSTGSAPRTDLSIPSSLDDTPSTPVSEGKVRHRPYYLAAFIFFLITALGGALAGWGWIRGLYNAWGEMQFEPMLAFICGSLIALIGLYFTIRSLFFGRPA